MELQNIFTAVCNMTVTGSIVILCVLAARLALAKAPKVFSWMLWLVVLLRLLCPVSVPGPASVLELVDPPRSTSGTMEYLEPPVQAPAQTVTPTQGTAHPGPAEQPIDWSKIGTYVWAGGAGALLAYGIVSYVNLKRKLRESVPLGKGIRETDRIASPFVLGRTIYLPAGLKTEERGYILLHEQLHLRHGDHIVKALFWLAVCLHWFNPLVWLGFFLCSRDMELRCDESVLKHLGPQVRSGYAQSLLDLATGRRFVPAPLAFGEGDTGKRVRFVLKWKKAKLWIAVPAAVLCAVVLVLTACDPAEGIDTPFGHSYRVVGIISSDPIEETPDLFTLTSDTALIVRQDGQTVMYGALKKVAAGTPLPVTMPEGTQSMLSPIESAWKTDDDGWWLFQKEDGELRLWREGEYLLKLERTDLLGVSIKQPGIEAYVEPVWYRSGVWERLPEEMSVTLVNEGAQIVLMPEFETDRLLVSEEYYERDGQRADTTTTDYVLEPDRNGDFILEVARRGTAGDDFAVYRVTVGEDTYIFQLSFPAVPGETSVSSSELGRVETVCWAEGGAKLALELPGNWEYDITSLAENDYAAGITFWPRGREEGKLRFEYYPQGFGVCGTGLETTDAIVAGRNASLGTYDGEPLWTFISFGQDFAVWGEGHEHWWAEYGEQAMEILNSAEFDLQGIDLSILPEGDWICELPVSPTEP